jgi:hypothetical protein
MESLQQLREGYALSALSTLPGDYVPAAKDDKLANYVYRSMEAGVMQVFDRTILRFLEACSDLRLYDLSFHEIAGRFLACSTELSDPEGMSPESKKLVEFMSSFHDVVDAMDKAKEVSGS